jgi:hypothetical protein
MDGRIPYTLGSVVTLTGAFMVGWVLHQVFVESAFGPTHPAAVLVGLGGLLAIAAGRRIERGFDPSAFVRDPEPEEDEAEFDEDFSPVSEEMLEGRERDDSRK